MDQTNQMEKKAGWIYLLALGLLAHGAAEQFGQGGSKAVPACCSICWSACVMGVLFAQAVRRSAGRTLGNTDHASEQGYAFFF